MKIGEDFQCAARERDITWWSIRGCSFCGVPIGYVFERGAVAFSSGCGCNSLDGLEERSWDDVAAHYNMQTHPDVIAQYNSFWGWADVVMTQPAVPHRARS